MDLWDRVITNSDFIATNELILFKYMFLKQVIDHYAVQP